MSIPIPMKLILFVLFEIEAYDSALSSKVSLTISNKVLKCSM